MKVRTLRNLTAGGGMYLAGAVLEMSDEHAAVAIREGNVEPAPDDAPLDEGFAHDAQGADAFVEASNARIYQERHESSRRLEREKIEPALKVLFDEHLLGAGVTVADCMRTLGLLPALPARPKQSSPDPAVFGR